MEWEKFFRRERSVGYVYMSTVAPDLHLKNSPLAHGVMGHSVLRGLRTVVWAYAGGWYISLLSRDIYMSTFVTRYPPVSSVQTQQTLNVLPSVNAYPLSQLSRTPSAPVARATDISTKSTTRLSSTRSHIVTGFPDEESFAVLLAMRFRRCRSVRKTHPYYPPTSTRLARALELGTVAAGRDVGVENLSMYVQCFNPAPWTCLQVQSFGSGGAWFGYVRNGGMNGQVGRIVQ